MLCPGCLKTDLIIKLVERRGKHIEENWVKDILMARLAHPSELQRGRSLWMASDASSYLCGSDVVRRLNTFALAIFKITVTLDYRAVLFTIA